MARSYTSRTILDGGQAKEEDFNSEIQVPLQEFNGQLDGHQLPLQQVTATHLAQPVVDQTYYNADGTYSSYMSTQSYHQSESLTWITPVQLVATNQLYYGNAWVKLSDIQIQTNNASSGAQVTFDALEGMLVGNAVIDFTYFPGEANVRVTNPDDPLGTALNARIAIGKDYPIQWAVFIDDVLVSVSGLIWPKRYTLDLPFSAPCSSKPVVIDIRFNASFVDPGVYSASLFANYEIFTAQSMTYNGGNLWVRNQYR
jgi:hypothetical protein